VFKGLRKLTHTLAAHEGSFRCGQLANCMEQGPSSEYDSSSASGEILRVLYPKYPYRVHKSQPFFPVLSQMNEVQTFPQHFFKICFNIIILSSTPRPSKWSVSLVFPTKIPHAQFVKRQ